MKALFHVHVFVSGGRQLCSLLYPFCQLHHVCRVDAEEDVQDFRQLRPGLLEEFFFSIAKIHNI